MSPIRDTFSTWMVRLSQWPHPAAPGSSGQASRIEVCPPQQWPSSLTWRGALQRWLNRMVHKLPEPARPVNRLALVKDEFLASVTDLQHSHAHLLAERIAAARSLRELWHLRSPTYHLVAVAMSQGEAERRLARLNRHFPTRATRNHPEAQDA